VSETDPVPNAETTSASCLAEPRELREITLESDDQTLVCAVDNPILMLLLKPFEPKPDPKAWTTPLPVEGSKLSVICGTTES
jgi:hypothetical protein